MQVYLKRNKGPLNPKTLRDLRVEQYTLEQKKESRGGASLQDKNAQRDLEKKKKKKSGRRGNMDTQKPPHNRARLTVSIPCGASRAKANLTRKPFKWCHEALSKHKGACCLLRG
mmetsp:Transcript_48680/g.104019  ORF Transcript_48680/g.104019 Transcript_48680/m.104019 type:complete len:114 (-) Transcript_48680:137-478(-)